jgi:hypothetical protein
MLPRSYTYREPGDLIERKRGRETLRFPIDWLRGGTKGRRAVLGFAELDVCLSFAISEL